RPAGPAPTMTTSYSMTSRWTVIRKFLERRRQQGRYCNGEVEQHLRERLALRVRAQAARAAAAERVVQHEVEAVRARQLPAVDVPLFAVGEHVREVPSHRRRGQHLAQDRQVELLARDHADVGVVALVAR